MSTTAKGNAFRDSVKRILELTPGCTNVRPEHLIGTQPVDLYYEERTSFGVMRVACECKDYGRPLTKDLIASNIFPRYSPLLANKQVDAVRIIAPLELGATASAYARECGFSFHTIDQIESEVIDFRQYLRSLQSGFSEDGLDQYYVPPQLADGGDLEERIDSWLGGDSRQPVAILAGYGMGKTSFAKQLAHRLARTSLTDPRGRIPILIPLSEISSEQTLEGLLGKLLSAQHRIPGYHFNVFMELNRRGRLVLILDGFDEMKHTMAWTEFKHNFAELNRLCEGHSRVLLLGRPSALLSDEEEMYVLRGTRRAGEQLFTVQGAPDYLELRIAPFSLEQALAFMHRYAGVRLQSQAHLRGNATETVDLQSRIEGLRTDPEMMALVLRPVQAKMLAELAMDPEVRWRSFNRYELYREFVSRITEREARKPTRSLFSQQVRESFIRRVAWWAWSSGTAGGFHIDQIPVSAFPPRLPEVTNGLEGARRDLVSGSLLEKKTGDQFYFPHRSFMEFLVAEFICLEGLATLDEIEVDLSPEIVAFIEDSGHAELIVDMSEDINEYESRINATVLQVIAWARNKVGIEAPLQARPDTTPRDVVIDVYRLKGLEAPRDTIVNFLRGATLETSDIQTRLVSMLELLELDGHANAAERIRILPGIVVLILSACLDAMARLTHSAVGRITIEKSDPLLFVLIKAFRLWSPLGRNDVEIVVDVGELLDSIEKCILLKWQPVGIREIPLSYELIQLSLSSLWAVDKRLALDAGGAVVRAFFSRFPDPKKDIRFSRGRRPRRNRRDS